MWVLQPLPQMFLKVHQQLIFISVVGFYSSLPKKITQEKSDKLFYHFIHGKVKMKRSQLTFICSNSKIGTLDKGVKYVQS